MLGSTSLKIFILKLLGLQIGEQLIVFLIQNFFIGTNSYFTKKCHVQYRLELSKQSLKPML